MTDKSVIVTPNKTVEPVQTQANQVQPDPPPAAPIKKFPFIMLDKEETSHVATSERQTKMLLEHSAELNMAEVEFALYLDPGVIRSDASVFTGPDFPYIFRWITQSADSYSSSLRMQAITRGYRPVDIRRPEFQDKLVVGRNALLLAIDRSPGMIRNYTGNKTPIPAPLPDQLKDKWGTMLPPVVQHDGIVTVGQRSLYYTEKEMVQSRRDAQRKAQDDRAALIKTAPNFLQSEVGGREQQPWEVTIPD